MYRKYKKNNSQPCGKCYSQCTQDFLPCSVCKRPHHRECLKMPKYRFNELLQDNAFLCSTKCELSFLPFNNVSDSLFLDVNVGKRKFPCKKCSRECENTECISCTVCTRLYHSECADFSISGHENISGTLRPFICSIACDMKKFPFSKVSNTTLYKDMESDFRSKIIKSQNAAQNPDKNKYLSKTKQLNDCNDDFSPVFCKYIDANLVPNIMQGGDIDKVSIFHSNVISLKKNLELVEEVFQNCNNYPNIISISETGIRDTTKSDEVSLPGYNFERHDSKTTKGGVGVYIMDHISYTVRKNLNLNLSNCENVWLELQMKNSKTSTKPLVIGTLYRHPTQSYKLFRRKLCKTIEKLVKSKTKFFIVGDVNINTLKYNLVKNVTEYVNAIKSAGCSLHINLPTRITRSTKSCIDHAYSNFEQVDVDTSVIISDISDHFSTLSKIKCVDANFPLINNADIYKRKLKLNTDEEKRFCSDLSHAFQNAEFVAMKCVNDRAKYISSTYQSLINKYMPLRKISKKELRFISKPWITRGLRISKEKKDRLFIKSKKLVLKNQ